jgi:hypothetical protein
MLSGTRSDWAQLDVPSRVGPQYDWDLLAGGLGTGFPRRQPTRDYHPEGGSHIPSSVSKEHGGGTRSAVASVGQLFNDIMDAWGVRGQDSHELAPPATSATETDVWSTTNEWPRVVQQGGMRTSSTSYDFYGLSAEARMRSDRVRKDYSVLQRALKADVDELLGEDLNSHLAAPAPAATVQVSEPRRELPPLTLTTGSAASKVPAWRKSKPGRTRSVSSVEHLPNGMVAGSSSPHPKNADDGEQSMLLGMLSWLRMNFSTITDQQEAEYSCGRTRATVAPTHVMTAPWGPSVRRRRLSFS